ncbi:hypothetical protein NA78x_002537 [Anatilimnocola sp. NA78]|uniref:hypothetical protein n=1 Tax=Anatilimnocola sp. NA78 TaxID=3415683 RepID=UPI003CE59436
MKRTIRILSMLALGSPLILAGEAVFAQGSCCGTPVVTQRVVYKTIYEQQPVKAFRLVTEQVLDEQEVTVQRPEWVTETRQRKFLVSKPVTETEDREERITVLRPVTETSFREETVDQTTWVTETENRQQRFVVNRPITETQMQQQQFTVRRPVQETVMQDQQFTTFSPVTTFQPQTVEMGGVVNQAFYQPGNVRNRLAWVQRGWLTDPVTGAAVWNRGGLRWVPMQNPGVTTVQPTFVSNPVTTQVPVTTMQPQIVTQRVPLNVTRFVDEVVTQETPIQVTRMQQVEEVRDVPVTVQRPVTQRITRKIPVETTRFEREEIIRPVQVTVQKIVTEEVTEDYNVQVQRINYEVRKVQVPRTVNKWVEYTAYRMVPKTVMMKVPVGSYEGVIEDGATTTFYAPASAPTLPPRVIYAEPVRVERRVVSPAGVAPAAAPAGTQGEIRRPAEATEPVKPKEEADKKPTLKKPAIEGPTNGPAVDPNTAPDADPTAPSALPLDGSTKAA